MSTTPHSKTALIYNPDFRGHHLQYVALIARGYHQQGYRVVFASVSDTFDSKEYAVLLQDSKNIAEKVKISDNRTSGNLYTTSIRETLQITRLIKEIKPDIVFIPYLDHNFYALGLLGCLLLRSFKPTKIEGILFRGDYAYQQLPQTFTRRLKKLFAVNILRHGVFTRILVLDILVFNDLKTKETSTSAEIEFCPECVESAPETNSKQYREKLGIPADAKVLGAFGIMDNRKGIDILINAFRNFDSREKDYLLLVGKQSEAIQQMLAEGQAARNIISINRFVTNAELLDGINSCDVIASTYPRHIGSSHIVIRAAAAKKPLLASDFGVIAHFVNQYRLGHCFDVADPSAFDKGLHWAFSAAECNIEKANELASLNTIENFISTITQNA